MIQLDLNVPNGFVCTELQHKEADIHKKFDELNLELVAVRSSAICEDSKENSFAGQFETILNVNKEKLINSIKQCFESSCKNNVEIYAKERNVQKSKTKVSVIVQEMIQGEVSGVIFTNNPINGCRDIVIEFVKGLGEKYVQGEITPSQVIINRSGEIKQYIGERFLSEKTLHNLLYTAMKIEEHYQRAQDIEWTLKDEKIYILQTRPIT